MPDVFCSVTGTARLVFTTLDLLKLNERVNESLGEIFLLSDQYCAQLVTVKGSACRLGQRPELGRGALQAERVHCHARHAGIVCGARVGSTVWYPTLPFTLVRPRINEETTAIKSGRHPILDRIRPGAVVGNDVLCCRGHSCLLVTGPNMSGKSTYLKQAGLLTIMAHMGMFVPAEDAAVRLCDAIYTRMGSDDDMESNASTFLVEMKEAAFALYSITERSLFVVDELGRGTSTLDGLAVTAAISEALCQTDAFVLMATHFAQLLDYLRPMPNVAVLNLGVEEMGDDRLLYSYRLHPGATGVQAYGLKMAAQAGLAPEVLAVARRACAAIKRAQGEDGRMTSVRRVLEKRKLLRQTSDRVTRLLRSSRLTRSEMLDCLEAAGRELQDKIELLDQ